MASSLYDPDGFLTSDVRNTHATAGIAEHLIYNDSNKNVVVHINTATGMSLTFPRSAYVEGADDARAQAEATQREFLMEAGEAIQFRATSTVDGAFLNVDSVFTHVRHARDGTLRHYRNPRSSTSTNRLPGADPGRLIVSEINV